MDFWLVKFLNCKKILNFDVENYEYENKKKIKLDLTCDVI